MGIAEPRGVTYVLTADTDPTPPRPPSHATSSMDARSGAGRSRAVRRAGAERDRPTVQLRGSHDPDARRRPPADGDPHARRHTGPLPILFRRTPYGVPSAAPTTHAAEPEGAGADGYIFVIQNLRGRFKSEGTFKLSSQVESRRQARRRNETTDAYDSIDGSSRTCRTTTARSACSACPTTASRRR